MLLERKKVPKIILPKSNLLILLVPNHWPWPLSYLSSSHFHYLLEILLLIYSVIIKKKVTNIVLRNRKSYFWNKSLALTSELFKFFALSLFVREILLLIYSVIIKKKATNIVLRNRKSHFWHNSLALTSELFKILTLLLFVKDFYF